jgi:hypothetical protein
MGEILAAPLTWLALAVITGGAALYWVGANTPGLRGAFGWLARATERSFGFEWVNTQVVKLTQRGAAILSKTQTGKLNWNVFGIAAALLAVLAIAFLGR